MKKEEILIIGAGLCGSLLALRLAQRGYKVTVKEMRSDVRKGDISAGKSINLALSDRGMKAMRLAGIENEVRELCIPMKGRMIHSTDGKTFLSPYSGREHEYINSISRGELNGLLLTEAEQHPKVEIHFNEKCTHIDIENNIAYFQNTETQDNTEYKADLIFGTDGAGSALRNSYEKQADFLFSRSYHFLEHGYKELTFPPTQEGSYRTEPNALHIWPRGNYMLIALPNLDGSFTVTLFLSHSEGKYNFKNLNTAEEITNFFTQEFNDATQLMPNLVEDFLENPVGNLGTVKCSPWHYKNNTLLLGDAAHAVVPFYGQGMNCSFEDVVVLDELIEKHSNNWQKIFIDFEARKEDTNAIADLAIDNFYEMRDHVANPLFIEKRKIEMLLEKEFPAQYFSKYSLVTFNEDIPYAQAMKQGRLQDKAIFSLLQKKEISIETNPTVLIDKITVEKEKLSQLELNYLANT